MRMEARAPCAETESDVWESTYMIMGLWTGSGLRWRQRVALKLWIWKKKMERLVRVDMGIPRLVSKLPERILVDGREREFVGIDVGNPHAVYFCPDVDSLDLEKIGPAYECHPRFPDRVNTEFTRIIDRKHIQMRVWERGSGETWACGTGATACAVAAMMSGLVEDSVEVRLKGGNLQIRWDRTEGHVYMTGPAVEVFCGEIVV